MISLLIQTLVGTVLALAFAVVTEIVAPVEKPTLASRFLGLQITLFRAVAVAVIGMALTPAWKVIGVPTISFGESPVGAFLFALFAYDFLAYWEHRFLHQFMWPVHATHHSIRELHALNSYGHIFEKFSEFVLIAIPLSLVSFGTPLGAIFLAWGISVLQIYIHSPTSAHLGPASWLIVDPRFHRIHHSLEQEHFDKNFGVLFTLWDRITGTIHKPAPGEWPAVGLSDRLPPRSILDYCLHPFRPLRRQSQITNVVNVPSL